MKILHTADWHIGQFKGPVVDGVNLRSQDTVKCLEYMVQVAIEEKPDIVCVSGDIFHQEQVGPVRYSDEMITATNIITSLAHFSKYVIVMRGTPNHDGAAQFRVLERMLLNIGNVDVVTEPGVIKTPWADIACLPGFDKQEFRAKFPGLSADEENLAWTKYISDMVFALRAECEKTPILMAHYTVPGCNMESGQTSFFTNFEPVIPREALMAARYEAVLLGHIHRPQIIEGFDNVFYSGAINAMNFNDEGQDRGFWIHEFNEKGTLVKGHRYTTPYRQFHTITWDPDEVGDYIREGAMYLHRTGISEDVTDKIVRVRYSCTSEQKKALNIPLLQKNLYELGAFYVADIEAESTIDITNRGLLSEESDPRLNLKKWLEEKTFKNPDKIVELAEPIIAEAMKQSTTAEIHGVFKPVSISVRNYRNYKEESFDFSDISFCTINGVNGAGKSSLFMDAIVDCLFEETREGDCKAWIRGTEDARSGSIEFIFDIGEKRFRVVRTRTKSGKPTLNLSQYQEESADWMNLSKERIVDTQAEIEKLLGMDSMTFRSCALIMQDQYGLFLQAKKDERIATRSAQWLCECECGTKKIIRASALKSGKSKSCGCHKNDYNKIHGGKGTRLYECWRHMRYRCDNKNNQAYEMYGARGIRVCDEWQEFGAFRDWALENGYSDNLTLDRIDVNGNYEPSNCRWADAVTQMNNRRSTPHYTVDGRSLTISQWSRETGIPRSTILNRLKRGMSFEAAIEKGDYKCQNS